MFEPFQQFSITTTQKSIQQSSIHYYHVRNFLIILNLSLYDHSCVSLIRNKAELQDIDSTSHEVGHCKGDGCAKSSMPQ